MKRIALFSDQKRGIRSLSSVDFGSFSIEKTAAKAKTPYINIGGQV